MQNFTLEDLMKFTLNEEKMIEESQLPPLHADEEGPLEQSLALIVQYAQSVSFRKSRNLGSMKFMLN